jgi:hypothetical protein
VSYLVAAILLAVVTWIGIGIRRFILLRRRLANIGLDGVRIWLNRLIDAREPNAFVIFEEMSPSKRFVQFRRDVGEAGATLTCHFPNAPWSIAYVPTLKQILATEHISFSEVPGRRNEEVTGFVTIENLDSSDATQLVDTIFRQVFGCNSVNVRLLSNGVRGDDVSSGVPGPMCL